MSEILATLQGLERRYMRGPTPIIALASATCTIRSGERIALVGQSGSGKSTLLHLLAGIDTPTKGHISWPALGMRDTLRPGKIGVVFQSPSLLAPLNVIENVELPLLLQRVHAHEARKTALETLEMVQLEALAEKLPEELSGGQAQRVAIARALASHPQLLLADEPTGQLDQLTAQHLFDVLLSSLAQTTTTLVVATHDKNIADRMQKIWHMQHGRLEEE